MAKTKNSPHCLKRPSCRGMQNRRYRKTEEAILEVLLKAKEMPSTGELTKRARISRSTLYRHHRAIPGIIPDYERDITLIFKQEFKKLIKYNHQSLENIYFKMLIFTLKHKRVFRILFKYSGDRAIETMVLEFKELIIKACHLPKGSEKMMTIYAKEIAGVVEGWGKDGFSEIEINHTLKNIMYLTATMKQRLSPVR